MRGSGDHNGGSRTESELQLPAERSELSVARKYVADVAEAFGFDAETCFEFVFAVNEAVTNAIRHGASDENGLIHLSIVADAERLTFSVRDRGTFVMPVLDGSMSAEHGRGLALMASLVDEVQLEIEPGGTTVRLSKART